MIVTMLETLTFYLSSQVPTWGILIVQFFR